MASRQRTKRLKFVGTAELVYMLGVSRQMVDRLTSREDFPEEAERLRSGKYYWMDDIDAWATATGRTLLPIPDTWPTIPAVNPQDADHGRYKRQRT